MRVITTAGSLLLLALSGLRADAHSVIGAQNLSAQSSDGKFLVEARSPANREADDRAWGGFVYRLVNRDTGEEIWKRDQPEADKPGVRPEDAEGLPERLWVDPDGRVVVWLRYDELIVLDAKRGERVQRTQVGSNIYKDLDESDRPLCWVSSQSCRAYFLRIPPASGITGDYFVVRAPLKGRLIFDLGALSALTGTQVLPAISEAADRSERDWATRALRSYASLPPGSCSAEFELQTAAWIAASLQIREAVDSLRELESETFVSCSGAGTAVFGTRQVIQLALRRLGEVPRGGPGICLDSGFERRPYEEAERFWRSAERPFNRAENAGLVAVGMSRDELLRAVGHPDYVVCRKSLTPDTIHNAEACCEYDMDGATSFTLRVRLDPEWRTVKHIERISPPLWAQGSTRESDLAPHWGR